MTTPELLLTTCRHPQQYSACVWDHVTGNVIHCYKNAGVAAPKTLNLIGYDYVLVADEDKPITHIWQLNSQEPIKKLSTILPDKIKVLTLCPNGVYLAAGIGPKLYMWQINSGRLFSIQKKHFQDVSCVKFSSDGNLVIVGGQDGILVVYDVESLVSLHTNLLSQSEGQVEPLYTKQDHSLPIMDIWVGSFGRFVTVSADNTCKIYNLSNGELLLNLVFDEGLTSVVFDAPCWNLFVGQNSGKIQQFLVKNPPKTSEHHVPRSLVFEGHEKRVNCLDLANSNGILVSGSDDNFVFVWEIPSRQILRRIEHKAAITNVKFVLKHENFFIQDLKVRKIVKNLDRELIQSEEFVMSVIQDFELEESDEDIPYESSNKIRELESENSKLISVNHKLYEVAMNLSRKYNNF